jgi:hypothetical protein
VITFANLAQSGVLNNYPMGKAIPAALTSGAEILAAAIMLI